MGWAMGGTRESMWEKLEPTLRWYTGVKTWGSLREQVRTVDFL